MFRRFRPSLFTLLVTLLIGVAIGFSFIGTAHPALSQASVPADAQTDLLHGIYAKANPSVVSINVRVPASGGVQVLPNRRNQPQQQQTQPFQFAAGSGFVYDTAGHIVTNDHVIDGADKIEIVFSDGTRMRATVVGQDPDADIAVLKVSGDISKYAPLAIADSDQVQVGDRAIAIGNPFERAGTMTHGIISGVHRSVQGLNGNFTIPDALQTDAAVNPGNSGGPLLNAAGDVIGVNQQIDSQVRQSSGVSFAIPSNLVKRTADALIKDGKVQHSYLGIAGTTVTLDMIEAMKLPANTQGAYVTQVLPSGPGAKAGLQAATDTAVSTDPSAIPTGGDIITAVDGQPVHAFDDLTAYLFMKTSVGQTVTLTVLRDGKSMDVKATLAARPAATSTQGQ